MNSNTNIISRITEYKDFDSCSQTIYEEPNENENVNSNNIDLSSETNELNELNEHVDNEYMENEKEKKIMLDTNELVIGHFRRYPDTIKPTMKKFKDSEYIWDGIINIMNNFNVNADPMFVYLPINIPTNYMLYYIPIDGLSINELMKLLYHKNDENTNENTNVNIIINLKNSSGFVVESYFYKINIKENMDLNKYIIKYQGKTYLPLTHNYSIYELSTIKYLQNVDEIKTLPNNTIIVNCDHLLYI